MERVNGSKTENYDIILIYLLYCKSGYIVHIYPFIYIILCDIIMNGLYINCII